MPFRDYAIRLPKAVDLKNFNNETIAKLPLDQIDKPIDLLPQEGGNWLGKFELGSLGEAELWLETEGGL